MTQQHRTNRGQAPANSASANDPSLDGPNPTDRQAAALLRQAMTATPTTEPDTLDAATITRVMNTLRAEGLFDHPPGHPSAHQRVASSAGVQAGAPAARPRGAAAPALVAGLPMWLVGALVALAAVVGWYASGSGAPTPAQDPLGMDTKHLADSALQKIYSDNPGAESGQLVVFFAGHGITAELQPRGAARLVIAEVPAAAWPKVSQGLASLGYAMPRDGRVAVLFEPLPR